MPLPYAASLYHVYANHFMPQRSILLNASGGYFMLSYAASSLCEECFALYFILLYAKVLLIPFSITYSSMQMIPASAPSAGSSALVTGRCTVVRQMPRGKTSVRCLLCSWTDFVCVVPGGVPRLCRTAADAVQRRPQGPRQSTGEP